MAEIALAFPKRAWAWGKPKPWGAPAPALQSLQVLGAPPAIGVRWKEEASSSQGWREAGFVCFQISEFYIFL